MFWHNCARFVSRHSVLTSIALIGAAALVFFWYIVLNQTNILHGNNQDIFFPNWEYFRMMLRTEGRVPLWNPYIYGGTPYQADPQTYFFYPFMYLLWFLPAASSIGWNVIIHTAIAGSGMYLYLQSLDRTNVASLIGAFAFMFSGFMVGYTEAIVLVNTTAWFPWVLLFFERSVRRKSLYQAVLGGIFFALAFLAGHPQLFYFMGIFLLLEAVRRSFLQYKWSNEVRAAAKPFIAACTIVVVALLLGAIQILPTVEFLQFTPRLGESLEAVQSGHWTFKHIITFILPSALGLGEETRPPQGNMLGFIGIIPLGLALLSIFHTKDRSRILLLWICTIGAILMAFGPLLPFYSIAYNIVPFFSLFRHPVRLFLISSFCFSILAAFGIDTLRSETQTKRHFFPVATILIIAALSIITYASSFEGSAQEESRLVFHSILSMTIIAGFSGAVFFSYKNRFKKIMPSLILLLLVAELFGTGIMHNYRPQNDDPDQFTVDEFSAMRQNLGKWRVVFPPQEANLAMQLPVEGIGGYLPLYLEEYFSLVSPVIWEKNNTSPLLSFLNVQFITRIEGDPPVSRTYQLPVQPRAQIVRTYSILSDEHTVDFFHSSAFRPTEEVILSTEPILKPEPFREADPLDKVAITSYREEEVKIEARLARPGILTLADIFYPAWQATVNDKKVETLRANRNFRAIALPAGSSKIVFEYKPFWYRLGLAISTITLLSLILCSGYFLYKRTL